MTQPNSGCMLAITAITKLLPNQIRHVYCVSMMQQEGWNPAATKVPPTQIIIFRRVGTQPQRSHPRKLSSSGGLEHSHKGPTDTNYYLQEGCNTATKVPLAQIIIFRRVATQPQRSHWHKLLSSGGLQHSHKGPTGTNYYLQLYTAFTQAFRGKLCTLCLDQTKIFQCQNILGLKARGSQQLRHGAGCCPTILLPVERSCSCKILCWSKGGEIWSAIVTKCL